MSHPFDHTMDDAWRHERFVVTIQQRTGIGWDKAERAAQATLETLAERVSAGVARDLAGRLPVAERRWLQPRGDAQPLDPVAFVRRVAEREQTDPVTAEAHVRAVFLALARRIGGREADDLAAVLPPELGSPLRSGRDRTGGKAQKMPLDEFLHSIAAREGVAPEDVLDHAQAVFKTIHEIVPETAWSHLLNQLPRDWPDALAPVPAPKQH